MPWSKPQPTTHAAWKAAIWAGRYRGDRIARLLGTTRQALFHALRKAKIRISPMFCQHSDQELQAECDSHADARAMAKKWGIHFEVVRKIMRARGMRFWRVKYDFSGISDEAWRRMYQEACYSQAVMAADFGVHRHTIFREFRRRGISVGRSGKHKYPWSKEELEYLWNVKGLGYNLIARVYGSTVEGAKNAMDRFGCVKTRLPIAIIGAKGQRENSRRGAMSRDGHFKMTRPKRLPSDDGWATLPLLLRESFQADPKGGSRTKVK